MAKDPDALRRLLGEADPTEYADWLPEPQGSMGRVSDVYDGDTVTLLCSISGSLYKFHTRILGVDCPEMRGRGAREKEAAKAVRDIVVSICRNKVCDVDTKGLDKYGRLIADIWITQEIRLSEYLLSWGLARPYKGGTRVPFTETEIGGIIRTCQSLERLGPVERVQVNGQLLS